MAEDRQIRYVNRDFNDFRTQLIEYAKNYFPETYNDFSPTSPGMMFIEMASYVGDVLSFYQDSQLQETFLTYAKDPKNLYSLAYMMGYRPKTTGVSTAEIEITQHIESTGAPNYLPQWNQAAIIPEDLQLTSTDSTQTKFIIDSRVDFTFSSSYDPTEVTIKSLQGNNPIEYTLKKKVKAISGEIITTTFTIDSAEQFKTLTIQDTAIVGILSIIDEEGREWTEVPYLGQDTIFSGSINSGTDSNLIPELLNLKKVPRRFATRHLSSGFLQIQFGAGTNSSDDSIILPDPLNVGLGGTNGLSKFDTTYDPSNFLYSKSYGVAPVGTLTVKYLKGGGVTANVPAGTITSQGTNVTVQANGDTSRISSEFLSFTNLKPAEGGRDGDTIEELRENSLRAFNEQGRTVTLQDYTVRAMSLPPNYGSIAKVYVVQDQRISSNTYSNRENTSPFALGMYVLAYDNNKKLITAPTSLKQNLKTYLSEYIMISDAINIRDAFVVNIGVEYDVVLRPNYSGRDVLFNCNNALKTYFNISKWNINQSINIGQIYTLLDKVSGVQTVQKVQIVNKQDSTGVTYSPYAYDIAGATKSNVVYPSYDPCIFEIKYPDQDIKGRVTVL